MDEESRTSTRCNGNGGDSGFTKEDGRDLGKETENINQKEVNNVQLYEL